MPENKDVDWVVPGTGELPFGDGNDFSALSGKNNEYRVTPTRFDEHGKPTHGRIDRVVLKGMPAPRNHEK